MTDQTFVSLEPATGKELWRGSASDVDQCVEHSRKAWPEWAAQHLTRRIELVRQFANHVRSVAEPFAELIARETGKPLWEARTEVDAVINKVEISVNAYAERTGKKRLNSALQGTAAVRHKPHGVMVVLGPYNFPAHLPNGHIIPALIAGNTVIFKPSEKTPAVGEFLVDCFLEAGLPDNVVQLAIGGLETGQALVGHDGIDGVLFTGSVQGGVAINRKLATDPRKIVALEMGGNNPLVVIDTPKLAEAAVLIVQSAFTTAGQRCTAARRLVVLDHLYEPLMEEVLKLTRKLIVDEPFADPAPFMGPVIDNETADLLSDSFVHFLANGGKVLKHMRRPDAELPLLTPGIIDTTEVEDRPDMELFGPILQVIRVPDFESAIAEANNTRFGLSASLVGGTPADYNRFWASVRAGIINWNKPTNGASSAAPFGGIGLSGNHRPAAYYAADYCAYPVASTEMEQPRANIGIGLAPEPAPKDD